MDKVKIGIVGLGYWGPKLLQKFSGIEGAEVVRLCEKTEELLHDFSSRYPTRYPPAASFEELIADPAYPVDAVVIATEPKSHAELSRLALERGLHVFVEKPLAINLQDAQILARLAREKNLVLMVDHTFCYDNALLHLRRATEDRKYHEGEIQQSSFEWLGARKKPQGPDVLWDSGPHAVAAMIFLLQKVPQGIRMRVLSRLSDVPSAMTGEVEFSDGTRAKISLAWQDEVLDGQPVEKAARVTLFSEKGKIVYEGTFGKREVVIHQDGSNPLLAPGLTYEDEPLRTVCEEFVRAIVQGQSPVVDGVFGAQVVAVLDAAERSYKQGGGRVEVIMPQLS